MDRGSKPLLRCLGKVGLHATLSFARAPHSRYPRHHLLVRLKEFMFFYRRLIFLVSSLRFLHFFHPLHLRVLHQVGLVKVHHSNLLCCHLKFQLTGMF